MKKLLPLALLALVSSQLMAAEAPALKCFGTEPFWGITTKGSTLTLENIGEEDQAYSVKSVGPAVGTAEGWTTLITAENNKSEKLSLITRKEECNDGMSDNVYTYSAFVQVGDSLLVGCCNDN